jgi:hypothetical protein
MVEFGPSRSKRFRKAVEEARSGAGECSELEPGCYRVRFLLNRDAHVFTSLARLLQRVRGWRASEVYEGERLVSSYHARDIEVSGCPKSSRLLRGCLTATQAATRVVILEHSPGQTLSSLSAAGSRRE